MLLLLIYEPNEEEEKEESIHDRWYTREEEPPSGFIPDAWRGTYGDEEVGSKPCRSVSQGVA